MEKRQKDWILIISKWLILFGWGLLFFLLAYAALYYAIKSAYVGKSILGIDLILPYWFEPVWWLGIVTLIAGFLIKLKENVKLIKETHLEFIKWIVSSICSVLLLFYLITFKYLKLSYRIATLITFFIVIVFVVIIIRKNYLKG